MNTDVFTHSRLFHHRSLFAMLGLFGLVFYLALRFDDGIVRPPPPRPKATVTKKELEDLVGGTQTDADASNKKDQ